MKTQHTNSEVVHDLCSRNSANKLLEIAIPSLDFFFNPSLPIYLEILLK